MDLLPEDVIDKVIGAAAAFTVFASWWIKKYFDTRNDIRLNSSHDLRRNGYVQIVEELRVESARKSGVIKEQADTIKELDELVDAERRLRYAAEEVGAKAMKEVATAATVSAAVARVATAAANTASETASAAQVVATRITSPSDDIAHLLSKITQLEAEVRELKPK